MSTPLIADAGAEFLKRLKIANDEFLAHQPGPRDVRQPVHTVYGGAHLFRHDSAARLGELALTSLRRYAPDSSTLASALGINDSSLADKVYSRVMEKLRREPVEDFRIDFEDGYGNRPDAEEDACAESAAEHVARGMQERSLPPFIGIRIKPLSHELHRRSMRTLEIFMTALCDRAGGRLPDNFVVTLPKVVHPAHVETLVEMLAILEKRIGLADGLLKLELMIETPQSILDWRGRCALPLLVQAGRGRCIGAHFGVYDYTSLCGITAEHQGMTHPACDFARHMMQVALVGTGIFVSDGATNIMPVPPHRAPEGGDSLSPQQERENLQSLHRAWKLHFDHVRHSLRHAYYQGWDLHPAQLPTRYAALFWFFLEGLDAAAERLRHFIEKAAQATLVGDVFDDAATGQGLLNFFLRGLNCGAITPTEAERAGLTLAELRSRSFMKILAGRSVR